ncbi:MAG: stage V sporulation T C-terminal domain-containing protein [Eubacteriales bacterium]|nr:stage V sporulation T C-terminal domain-containing protein [Eubacteriales bacterium]
MKATGMVRRIDDLGRIVIPKEIRRTMRIREGDPLEIFTDKDGELIFKKYSPIGELADFAAQICESLKKSTECIAAVCDRDNIIAIAGGAKKELFEKPVSGALNKLMESRETFSASADASGVAVTDENEKYAASVASPIISQGDVMGCVLFVKPSGSAKSGEVEEKLARTVAAFLGKQMEN